MSGKRKRNKESPLDIDQTFSDDDTEISKSEGDVWVPPTTAGLDSDDSLESESSDWTVVSDSNDNDTSGDETDNSDDGIPLLHFEGGQ